MEYAAQMHLSHVVNPFASQLTQEDLLGTAGSTAPRRQAPAIDKPNPDGARGELALGG